MNANVVSTEMLKVDEGYTDQHYTKPHWVRATKETSMQIEDVKEPIVALIEHGFEINHVHGFLREGEVTNQHEAQMENKRGNPSNGGATRGLPKCMDEGGGYRNRATFLSSGDVILGEPYIMAARMEMKVLRLRAKMEGI